MIVQVKCLVRASSVVALDAMSRHDRSTGASVVSVCHSYEVVGNRVATVTSYAVKVDPGGPSPATADRWHWAENVGDA